MKKILILLFLAPLISNSQILEPIEWTTSVEKISNTEYNLIFKADIETNYHLYSQKVPNDGPKPTLFIFEKSENFELIGKAIEEKGHISFDSTFEMKIKYFEKNVVFKQRVKVRNDKNFNIIGEIEFMTCNDSSCIFGYEDFEFKI